ncbi:hypothetical protein ACEQ8H_003554 [Pleosporales sp. CAS-2024a]
METSLSPSSADQAKEMEEKHDEAKATANSASKSTTSSAKELRTWGLAQLLVFALIGALAATFLSTSSLFQNSSAIPLDKIKILSFDPLVLHITDFVSASERAHLLKIGTPLLKTSLVYDSNGNEVVLSGRNSSTAFLPQNDSIVARIATRAATLHGFLSPIDIDLQITAYNPGQQYKHHYDWYEWSNSSRSHNRVSTIFAILKSTCTSCGTEFAFLNTSGRGKWDARWCDIIDCSKEVLTTKNVEGSAVMWVNLDTALVGRHDVLHAGLPAVGGEKVGLNVWADLDLEEIRERGMFAGWIKSYRTGGKEFYWDEEDDLQGNEGDGQGNEGFGQGNEGFGVGKEKEGYQVDDDVIDPA